LTDLVRPLIHEGVHPFAEDEVLLWEGEGEIRKRPEVRLPAAEGNDEGETALLSTRPTCPPLVARDATVTHPKEFVCRPAPVTIRCVGLRGLQLPGEPAKRMRIESTVCDDVVGN
jgi:hypothetical protein